MVSALQSFLSIICSFCIYRMSCNMFKCSLEWQEVSSFVSIVLFTLSLSLFLPPFSLSLSAMDLQHIFKCKGTFVGHNVSPSSFLALHITLPSPSSPLPFPLSLFPSSSSPLPLPPPSSPLPLPLSLFPSPSPSSPLPPLPFLRVLSGLFVSLMISSSVAPLTIP